MLKNIANTVHKAFIPVDNFLFLVNTSIITHNIHKIAKIPTKVFKTIFLTPQKTFKTNVLILIIKNTSI